jgi:hypothetical protein
MSLEGFPAVVALFIFLAIPISLATLIIGRTSRFAHRKKQLRQNTIIAEYEPPGHLSPAEIGYLFDSRLSKTELVATLVMLEQKGLADISDGTRIRKREVTPPKDLREHERYVLDSLGIDSNLSIFALTTLAGFKKSIKKSLSDQGYLKTPGEALRYYAKRTFIAYVLITIPVYLGLASTSKGNLFLIVFMFVFIFMISFPFFLGLALVAGFIYGKLVGQPGLWTQKLRTLWPQLQGYRDFIEKVELDELQFESKDLKERSKNKALPYAIALGLNTEWRERFHS